VDDLRIRLIERLCRLPETQLADVEALLVRLDDDLVEPSTQATTIGQSGGLAPQSKAPPSKAPQLPLPHQKDWPHAPIHRLSEYGTYIVTASTLHKDHLFRGEEKLTLLENKLLLLAKQYDVILEAWAVFSNHYHFVAHTTGAENQLANLIARFHYETAEAINRWDGSAGRPLWFNYWDTKLTFEKSYLARLNYVHQNAAKHGLVRQANDYRWCSAGWFERTATRAQVKTIYGFKTDRVKIDDDYQPVV
jgi:putative transposase